MRDFKIFIMRVYCVSAICPYIIEPKQEEVKNEIQFYLSDNQIWQAVDF